MSGIIKAGEVIEAQGETRTGTPLENTASQCACDPASNSLSRTCPKTNLHDAHAIRREMAAVYRDMRAGRIETSDGTKLAYVLAMMIKAYEAAVLEERMERIEATINRRIKK